LARSVGNYYLPFRRPSMNSHGPSTVSGGGGDGAFGAGLNYGWLFVPVNPVSDPGGARVSAAVATINRLAVATGVL
jgi:hypothetical protein